MRGMKDGEGDEAGVWREAREATAVPEVGSGVIDVWRVRLSGVGDEWVDLLCARERERAEAMVDVRLARLWGQGRGVLRELLGGYLARNPRELWFEVGERGKPALARSRDDGTGAGAGGGLRFNLSHSGELMLVGVSRGREVGVDVEERRRPAMDPGRVVAVARRGLGEETGRRLEGLAPERREEELLRAWTAHEAAVKCGGIGIGDRDEHGGEGTGTMWRAAIDLGPEAFGALAAEGEQEALVRCWEWRG
jgi:4'-phosphopantetheinyl transferase